MSEDMTDDINVTIPETPDNDAAITFVQPSAYIFDDIGGYEVVEKIEECARICYQGDNKRERGELLKQLLRSKHETPLEHVSVTVFIETSRAVSLELARHRPISMSMASQRFINYGNKPVRVIVPVHLLPGMRLFNLLQKCPKTDLSSDEWEKENLYRIWKNDITYAVRNYKHYIKLGWTPQEARTVLPNAIATQLYMTANLREWRHIFNLRVKGTTGKPDPNMEATMSPLLEHFVNQFPLVFDDILTQ